MKKVFLALIISMFSSIIGISAYADDRDDQPEQEHTQAQDMIFRLQPIDESVDRQNASAAGDYFYSCLTFDDEYGDYIYPDTYGGSYPTDDGSYLILVTESGLSEYLFLQEEFPCVVLEQVKYSYNYLQGLVYDYINSWVSDPDNEEILALGYVDVYRNRAVVEMDEESLSRKDTDPDSPIIFEYGEQLVLSCEVISDTPDDVESGVEPIEDNTDNTVDMYAGQKVIKGGQKLDNYGDDNKPDFSFSAGIGCVLPGPKYGLIANAHEMKLNDRIYLDGEPIGRVTFVSLTPEGKGDGDYCFITLDDGYIADGATYTDIGTIRFNHVMRSPKLEDKLFKYTQEKGYAAFTVKQLNVIGVGYDIDGNKVISPNKMVMATIDSGTVTYGDSGAGVYHNSIENDSTSFLEFSGIISGSKGKNVYFTPPTLIKNCLICFY